MTSPSTSNGSTTEVNAKILENPTRTQRRSARSCYQSTQLSNVSDDKVRGAHSSTRGRSTAKSSRRRSKASKLDDVTIPALVRKLRRHNKKTHDSNTPTNPNSKLSKRTSKSSVTTSISSSSNLPTQSASSASSTSSSVGRVIQLAKEAADLDFECYGRKTTIMDLILDAKPPVDKYAEDVLMDAMDLGKKFNSSLPPPPPNHSFRKAKDLVGYWAQQESMWRGRQFGVYEDSTMDFSPRNIYNVSAERTTASWSSDKEEDREHGDIIGLLDSSTAATNSTGYLSSNATTTSMSASQGSICCQPSSNATDPFSCPSSSLPTSHRRNSTVRTRMIKPATALRTICMSPEDEFMVGNLLKLATANTTRSRL